MIPELGQFALALALIVALAQAIVPLAGAARGDAAWIALARPAAQTQALLVAFAFGCLTHAFVANDFSVAYVAAHSNSTLPLHYRIAGVWGGHEGSLLLWTLMLAVWMTAVSLFSGHLPEEMTARVLGVMGMVSAGFLAFMLFTSNPFDRQFPPAPDGHDLNPLLQDPGMVVHPPMLYMGYVGFSVADAFAVVMTLFNSDGIAMFALASAAEASWFFFKTSCLLISALRASSSFKIFTSNLSISHAKSITSCLRFSSPF